MANNQESTAKDTQTSKTNAETQAQPKKVHHYFRTFFAGLSGFIALNLILLSILVVWLGDTLTNTNTYVSTVSSLAKQEPVQEFVASKLADTVTDQTTNIQDGEDSPSIRDIMGQLVPQDKIDGKSDEQLKQDLHVLIHDQLRSVLASDKFSVLWADTNRDLHQKLLEQVNSTDGDFELDFHDILVGTFDLLKGTKFDFITDKIDIPSDVGVVKVESSNFDQARKFYNYFKIARIALLACAFLSAVITVLLSVHHMKTLRRMAVLTAVFTGLMATLLSAGNLFKNMKNAPQDKDLILAMANVIFKDLRIILFSVAGIAVLIAVDSKIFELIKKKKSQNSPDK